MKVGDAVSLAPAQVTQRSNGTATTSFATLLASGRSVSAIRSERAFGFSETGLLGASRATDLNGPASVRPRSFEASELPTPQSSQSQSASGNRVRETSGAVAVDFVGADLAISDRAYVLSNMRGKNPLVLNFGHQPRTAGTDSQSHYLKTLQSRLPMINADRRLPAEKWQRRLSLLGSDDALSISIHEFSSEEHQDSELFFIFSNVTRQFGMTLRLIRLHTHGFNRKLESGRV